LRENTNACDLIVGKPEGMRSLERYRHIWEGNIKMDHEVIVLEDVDCSNIDGDLYK
jgi:hypothetical protein